MSLADLKNHELKRIIVKAYNHLTKIQTICVFGSLMEMQTAAEWIYWCELPDLPNIKDSSPWITNHPNKHSSHQPWDAGGFFELIQGLVSPFGIQLSDYITADQPTLPPTHATQPPASKGKFYPSTNGMPDTLKWGATPTDLKQWFMHWELWYRVACPNQNNPPLLWH